VGIVTGKQDAAMTSTNGQNGTQASDGEGLQLPSPEHQDLLLDAWREALGQALYLRDNEWKQQLGGVTAECRATVAELRASVAEICSKMEKTISERLAQIREPADGKEGPPGEPGPRGEAGPPGMIEGVRAYVQDAVNHKGDIVVREGSTYLARCDTGRAPPHPDWACIAAAGRDARMPKVCGTYRDSESYKYLDIVTLNGSAFVAKCDCPGDCPSDGWQLIASAGRAGKPGPKGERGERGLPGLPGPYLVRGWIDGFTLTLALSDNSKIEIPIRAAFEKYHEEANG
jgi:hypothetical protein